MLLNVTKFKNLYFIGIKGSGMCSLAILLKKMGHEVLGSDVADTFFTDELLKKEQIRVIEGFSSTNINKHIDEIDAVVYSPAYAPETNEELKFAASIFPCFSYPEALGGMSKFFESCAVIGTHGKTTTSAITGVIAEAAQLPVMSLSAGSVDGWDSGTLYRGNKFFISEVCEYRNHFEYFYPNYAIFTSAEHEHPDYFESEEVVFEAFRNFLFSVDRPKRIIAYGDDSGVINSLDESLRKYCIFYGEGESNDVRLQDYKSVKGRQEFRVLGLSEHIDAINWEIIMPGKHIVMNTLAALSLIHTWAIDNQIEIDWEDVRKSLQRFKGVDRRCEIIYKDSECVILDDYAHHPTAIQKTLEGIKDFYEPKRLIVDFMSHTYSRTYSFLNEFARSFELANVLIINDIYSSAREKKQFLEDQHVEFNKGDGPREHTIISGTRFAEEVKKYHDNVVYIPEFEKAEQYILDNMKEGDVILTMGAGDNFRISHSLAKKLQKN